MDKLLAVLREKAYDTKPNVDDLKKIEGLEDVNAELRDKAWAAYQVELKAAADANASDKKSKSDTKTDKPTHRVSVKKDGFRRLGHAWTGSTEVALSAKEAAMLKADPMFVVQAL